MAYKTKMLRMDDSLLGEKHLCAIREGSKKRTVSSFTLENKYAKL
jgi:hypothetical protein